MPDINRMDIVIGLCHDDRIDIDTFSESPDIGLETCDILRIWETKGFSIDGETNNSLVVKSL